MINYCIYTFVIIERRRWYEYISGWVVGLLVIKV